MTENYWKIVKDIDYDYRTFSSFFMVYKVSEALGEL